MWIIKKFRYHQFNKQRHTNIRSNQANLKANYGVGVDIAENVVITENVTIGKYSYINKNSSVENCVIGNFCSISSGVWIGPYEHDLKRFSTHPVAQFNNQHKKQKVVIGNDVLVSLNAIILCGVHVGDGAVIGAGAVVTKNVKPYEIVGGVPATHIGWRFDEEICNKLAESKWWNNDADELDSKGLEQLVESE